MKTGVTHFTNGIQPFQIRLPVLVDHYATTGVMGCWHDRHGLLGQVETEFQQFFINGREMLGNEFRIFMADVDVHAVGAKRFIS